jgi:AsmA-like C-terminal region/Protein of unknown function
MDGASEVEAGQGDPAGRTEFAPATRQPRKRGYLHGLARLAFTLMVVLAIGFGGLAILALSGKTIQLPVWAVAEVEQRINKSMRAAGTGVPALTVSIGAADIVVPADWVPRIRLEDVEVRRLGGAVLMTLPEARVELEPTALTSGQVRLKSLALVGARLSVRRGVDGQFDLSAKTGTQGKLATTKSSSFAALLDAADAAFDAPALTALDRIDVEGVSLTVTDDRAGRRWEMGDGRLVIERRPDALALELGVSLIEGGNAPALATLAVVTARQDASARLTITVNNVAASDVAAVAPPLAFLSVLDAPMSGRIAVDLDQSGSLSALEGELDLGAGALQPQGSTSPIPFEKAGMALRYDPQTAAIDLQRLSIQSRSVRMNAAGRVYLRGADGLAMGPGTLPVSALSQIRFSDVQVDPAGLFEAPVRFSSGALDMRLTLQPFGVNIGQLALEEAGQHLMLSGDFGVQDAGWTASADVALDRIRHDRLMKLWPLQLVPKTRLWLDENVQAGDLFNVQGSWRTSPGTEPRFRLGYEFGGVDVRFLRSLPPIKQGSGRASIDGLRYVMALDKGHVIAPEGGRVTVDGSVFKVADITQKPTRADITLVSRASLAATLSILDQPPFQFATKAGQPVQIGTGEAELVTELSLPLVPKVKIEEVSYSATGTLRNVASSVIVPGRVLTAAALSVSVTQAGMQVSGPGTLDGVGFDVRYSQGFSPDAKGKSRIEGQARLTDAGLRVFGVALPEGTLKGETTAQLVLDLVKGQPGRLRATSDLRGMSVSIPALGYRKGADGRAALAIEARLGPVPEVTSLTMDAPGLEAKGAITLRKGGGLDVARFSTLRAGDWLNAQATVTGQGTGRAAAIALTGGRLDLRQLPERAGGTAGGPPLTLQLDQVVVSSGIALTDFRGTITDRGGMAGDFVASVNGNGRVQGAIAPQKGGSAIRIRSDNAGRVLAAAGIFSSGRGGALELVVKQKGNPGSYIGTATIDNIRVVDAPVLAELLSAVSVIGLLEQLNGNGLLFSDVDVNFKVTGGAVEITKGSAVGASIGVSFAGLYDRAKSRLDLQGVVSPLYLLNGIGSILTRRGEGLFGFNYRLRGSPDDPRVSVNPLSILTPGMFREIFRRPPPVIEGNDG